MHCATAAPRAGHTRPRRNTTFAAGLEIALEYSRSQTARIMAEKEFRPGEQIPDSGVYLVVHREHRPTHEATLVAGKPFPPCARCGKVVRFRLLRNASSIEMDADFGDRAGGQ